MDEHSSSWITGGCQAESHQFTSLRNLEDTLYESVDIVHKSFDVRDPSTIVSIEILQHLRIPPQGRSNASATKHPFV